MKNNLMILGFTVLVTLFYWYVGQQVPQKEDHPPKELEFRPDMTTEELVEIGKQIFEGKGTCKNCHGLPGGRFPNLDNIGAIAGTRKPGYTDVEYLAESLYEPNAYIVEGFAPGMPEIAKPPIGLSDQEILAVIAYLQSRGGTPTVTLDTKLKWQSSTPAATATPTPPAPPPTPAVASGEALDGPALMQKYLCLTCHNVDNPAPLVGPSLYDVGKRLTKAQLYEAILDPDATIAEGFPGGLMKTTLEGVGFYDQLTTKQLQTLVDYLASRKGEQ
ncbi:MAG: hypothetical protein D6681_02415 [Calditrichaeota bacterium]|nr:MAG: hypothetical protein D6681_02415 [Calditrichota bacterium]